MRETLYCSSVNPEGRIILSYALYEEEKVDESIYSIEITEYRGEERTDSVFIYDVCREERGALDLVRLLESETVTPCTALYILDELLPV